VKRTEVPAPERVESALRRWLESAGLASYDPYDALDCRPPWSLLRRAQLAARLWTQLVKRSPVNIRPLVGVRPRLAAKSLGDLASAALLRHRLGDDPAALATARELLAELRARRLPGWSGACWGMPTPYVTRYIQVGADVPNLFWTVCIAATFMEAYELLGTAEDLELARSCIDFVRADLGVVDEGERGVWCRYFPGHDAAVYNVTALTGALLIRIGTATGESELAALGRRAVRFVLGGQNADGSWPYARGASGRWVDGFHTGYVLEALLQVALQERDPQVAAALERGVAFYHERLLTPEGVPRYMAGKLYPIEVQNCAQAIQTLAKLCWLWPQELARAEAVCRQVTPALFRFTRRSDGEAGYFVMSRGRWFVNRLAAVRWGQAPMLLALTYLRAARAGLPPPWQAERRAATAALPAPRKQMLFLSALYPVPVASGTQYRVLSLLQRLSQRFDITFLCLVPAPLEPAHAEPVRALCRRVVLVVPDNKRGPHLRAAYKAAFWLRRVALAECADRFYTLTPSVVRAVRSVLESRRFDVLFLSYWFWIDAVAAAPGTKVIDANDVQAERVAQELERSRNPLERLQRRRLLERYRAWEAAALTRADLVVATTRRDRQVFEAAAGPGVEHMVVPTGIDTEYFAPRDGPVDLQNVVFYGALGNPLNTDAVEHLVRDILPRLRARLPGVRLTLVGSSPTPAMRRLAAADAAITLTGWVEDVRQPLGRAGVVVLPLRMGHGIRGRVFELLSMAIPVVATPVAVAGMDLESGDGLLLADSPDACAAAVERVLREPELRAGLGRRGRQLALARLGMQPTYDRLAARLDARPAKAAAPSPA
jgi:glycosyltransferase involved in cell wall biosynthesis